MTTYLRIAVSQFPVSGNLVRNYRYVKQHIIDAARKGAHVIHFPESALSGYGPAHFASFAQYAWTRLDEHTRAICDLAASRNLWVIVGSMRQVKPAFPRNCLYVISPTGDIAGVYDKQRLYQQETEYYSSGTTPFVLDINGFTCGFLICYDNCFPELYAAYRDLGVELLFHAFHNAGNPRATSIKDLMQANCRVRAADHQMWIAASNSSRRYSPLSACIVRPDGTMVRATRHVTGMVMDDYPLADLGWTYDNRTR